MFPKGKNSFPKPPVGLSTGSLEFGPNLIFPIFFRITLLHNPSVSVSYKPVTIHFKVHMTFMKVLESRMNLRALCGSQTLRLEEP